MFEVTFLTDNEDIKTICELYWEIDSDLEFIYKVREIADLLEMENSNIMPIVRENSLAQQPDWKCNNCSQLYRFSNRTDFISNRDKLNQPYIFLCKKCQEHIREVELKARRKREEEDRKRKEESERDLRKQIREIYNLSNRPNVDVSELSFLDIIYLVSILRAGAFEGMTKIMPLAMFDQPLSPTDEFTSEITKHLLNANLIYIHPDNEPEAFHNGDPNTYYIWSVYYAPPANPNNMDDPNFINREMLRKLSNTWPKEWNQEAFELWKRISLEECKEYLLFVLDEHHFEFSPGEKTTQYLEYALEYFSTAQVFSFIWRSAKDAAAYYQRGSISKRQAANSAISAIQRSTERAISNGWNVKPYGRNFNCPQSVISEVLYNSALRFGDAGFSLVPNIEAVENKEEQGKEQSQYTIYHSQDLVEKWKFNPDKVLGEYGTENLASGAQIQFLQSLASQYPNEAQELEKVINSTTPNSPFTMTSCTNGLAKWLITTFLSLQDSEGE